MPRKNKLTQQKNEELITHNKDLQSKIQKMDVEYSRLQKRPHALDGLTMLEEAARKLCFFMISFRYISIWTFQAQDEGHVSRISRMIHYQQHLSNINDKYV